MDRRPAVITGSANVIEPQWHLTVPDIRHGAAVTDLIARCPPLDPNSAYCNLLQCLHFAGTSIVALDDADEVVGFVSAYRLPDSPQVLFVWQVAVAPAWRGSGLARAMVLGILRRPACAGVSWLETSITRSNRASWSFFKKLADCLGCPMEGGSQVLFDRQLHFHGQHDSELQVRLGPFGAVE